MQKKEKEKTMDLNKNEAAVLKWVKEDPYISQKELAKKLELSRPAIANIISRLVGKGYLLGRAYIVNHTSPTICIGGADIDKIYQLKRSFQKGTTNQIEVTQEIGGVARNIAENLGRLEREVELFSVVGDDMKWQQIEQASSPFMETTHVMKVPEQATGTSIEMKNERGQADAKLAEDKIYEQMSVSWLTKQVHLLRRARHIIADLNCPKEVIEYLQSVAQQSGVPLVVVTVSIHKMQHLPHDLTGIHLFALSNEAETDTQCDIQNEQNLQQAADYYLKKGAESVLISKDYKTVVMGAAGGTSRIFTFKEIDKPILSFGGVKEAFYAGLLHACIEDLPIIERLKMGYTNAFYTAHTEKNVRTDLSKAQLEKECSEMKDFVYTMQMIELRTAGDPDQKTIALSPF